jgi:hypothetical protein
MRTALYWTARHSTLSEGTHRGTCTFKIHDHCSGAQIHVLRKRHMLRIFDVTFINCVFHCYSRWDVLFLHLYLEHWRAFCRTAKILCWPEPQGRRERRCSWQGKQSLYVKENKAILHDYVHQLFFIVFFLQIFFRQEDAFEHFDALPCQLKVKVRHPTNNNRIANSANRSSLLSLRTAARESFIVCLFTTSWIGMYQCAPSASVNVTTRYSRMSPKSRHVYEIIREGSPCRAYFDIEYKVCQHTHIHSWSRRKNVR